MNFKGIDKISPVPYYYQLEQLLREKIENGRLKPGDILPSEAELCSTFRVSRTVGYFEAWHRGDRCKFAIELVPVGESQENPPYKSRIVCSGLTSL